MERTPGSTAGDDATARQAAADAAAMAANARQMVLNRDSTLTALQQTAATASQAVQSSEQDRAALHQQLDALAAIAPQKGDQGLKGDKGDPGSPVTIASGQGKTAALIALGGSSDVVVTLTRTMPSTSYNVEIIPTASGLSLGNATMTVKSRTTTTVTVTIAAAVAVGLGSTFSLIAWG